MKSIYFIVLLLSFYSQKSLAQMSDVLAIQNFNEGVDHLKNENPAAAEKKFLSGLLDKPFDPMNRMGLGESFFEQKKYDKALKEFDAVARQQPIGQSAEQDERRFKALFNAAVSAQEDKKVDLALSFYQKALEIKPDSIEVKTNIELLNQGGGSGSGESQNQNQEPNQQGQNPDPSQSPQNEPKKEKGVDQRDVKDILEELERQEQKIRALEYGDKKGREKGPSKDW